jgi:hypothetical protein
MGITNKPKKSIEFTYEFNTGEMSLEYPIQVTYSDTIPYVQITQSDGSSMIVPAEMLKEISEYLMEEGILDNGNPIPAVKLSNKSNPTAPLLKPTSVGNKLVMPKLSNDPVMAFASRKNETAEEVNPPTKEEIEEFKNKRLEAQSKAKTTTKTVKKLGRD